MNLCVGKGVPSLNTLQQLDGPRRVEVCKSGKLWMTLTNLTTGEVTYDGPYQCRSWRCPGFCQDWHSKKLIARAVDTVAGLHSGVFATITLDQSQWASVAQQYHAVGHLWEKLRHRLRRKWGMRQYLLVWEKFRKGGVHGHLIMFSETLWQHAGETEHEAEWVYPWRRDCEQCGFGRVAYMRRLQEENTPEYYVAKCLAYAAKGKDKKYEVPSDAPKGFRRFAASRGFLAPEWKSPDNWEMAIRSRTGLDSVFVL